MSKKIKVAVPSLIPGGLDAERSGHFGRCDCFTLLKYDENKKFEGAEIVQNPPHVEGGCLAPVNLLAQNGATAIVVQGIGMRPLTGFRNAGIEVLICDGSHVKDVKENYEKGNVSEITENHVCGGH
ncbi:MAG: NifB/NifX family molybdenum-iron cluster-binding protein [Candidatus Wallbacteria bacterium]